MYRGKEISRIFDGKKNEMVYTTSLKHYKELKEKGVSVTLVTKSDINP